MEIMQTVTRAIFPQRRLMSLITQYSYCDNSPLKRMHFFSICVHQFHNQCSINPQTRKHCCHSFMSEIKPMTQLQINIRLISVLAWNRMF